MQLAGWKEQYPNCRLINMYGITETTVHVTYKEITEREIRTNVSNIGGPIPTLKVYVLDENRKPVPIGVPGEMYVSGAGVARGYLNRPELTAERFMEDPFEPGARMYRSGDLARWSPEGELEYLGRIDDQVKIRGHRIELGEIETAVLHLDEVLEAVVIDRKSPDGESQLVAYVVTTDQSVSPAGLRGQLMTRLPAYMIPSYFVTLESLPLTPNGKVDKAHCRSRRCQSKGGGIEPRNDEEQAVADVFAEVLNLPEIHIQDSFFDLGGDSITAIRLISRINRRMDWSLQVGDLYRAPTVEGLIQQSKRSASDGGAEERKKVLEAFAEEGKALLAKGMLGDLPPEEVEDLYPMSTIQQGMVYYGMKHRERGVYHDQLLYQLRDGFFASRAHGTSVAETGAAS